MQVLSNISSIVDNMEIPLDTFIIWGGNFNFIFDKELEASRGNPKLKLKSIESMKAINIDHDLCDIWRIRNPESKRFTWRGLGQGKASRPKKNYPSQIRLFFLSQMNFEQPFIVKSDIIPAPSTDHAAIIINLQ